MENENPRGKQVGGNHYSQLAIQPVEYIHRNGLGFIEGSVVKYVTRHRTKGGREDLEKAIHFLELLIDLEYQSEESMQVEKTGRGFEFISFADHNHKTFEVQQSSAIGEYEDAMERPGTSFLWIGLQNSRGHLNREQVAEVVKHLEAWLATGSLNL